MADDPLTTVLMDPESINVLWSNYCVGQTVIHPISCTTKHSAISCSHMLIHCLWSETHLLDLNNLNHP